MPLRDHDLSGQDRQKPAGHPARPRRNRSGRLTSTPQYSPRNGPIEFRTGHRQERGHVPSWSPDVVPSASYFAWVGEAEADVAGCAFGQGRSQGTSVDVVVVVCLGGGLAGMGAQDAAGLLDQPSFEGDGCGEEEGVQDGAVEALADEPSGCYYQQR